MPGVINALENTTTERTHQKSFYWLIIIVLIVFVLIYSQRFLGITSGYYNFFVVISILIITTLVLMSTLAHNLELTNHKNLEYLSYTFNSVSSRNFLLVFSYLLFVMYIYESLEYDNSESHHIVNTLAFGHNNYISNRTYGLLLILVFGLYVAYTIYITTEESYKMNKA